MCGYCSVPAWLTVKLNSNVIMSVHCIIVFVIIISYININKANVDICL